MVAACSSLSSKHLSRLHWEEAANGWFEELVGPDKIGLPNGLAWDSAEMYHADTYHRTITSYSTDSTGALKRQSGQSIQGEIVVQTSQDPGKMQAIQAGPLCLGGRGATVAPTEVCRSNAPTVLLYFLFDRKRI